MASKDNGPKKESKTARIGAQTELNSDEEFSDDEKATDDAKFRAAFNPKSKSYHGGQTVLVPMGGQRVPESMGGAAAADWMSLPEVAPETVNPTEFGAEYVTIDKLRNDLTNLKKVLAAMGPPCGAIMANMAHLGRANETKNDALATKVSALLTGEEKKREAAVARLRETSAATPNAYAAEIEECCVEALALKGVQTAHTSFDAHIKQVGQKIFRETQKQLDILKDIKKKHLAAKKATAPSKTSGSSGGSEAPKRVPLSERPLPAGILAAMAEAAAASGAAPATSTDSTPATTSTPSST